MYICEDCGACLDSVEACDCKLFPEDISPLPPIEIGGEYDPYGDSNYTQ